MAKSVFRNWRRSNLRAKAKEISEVFPVSARPSHLCPRGLQLEFQDVWGKTITFDLNEHDTALLFMQIDKYYHKKEVTRADYNLDSLKSPF